jgi:2-C-methyl-D-erythritol 4-phosphate cytidylyltransferase
VTGQWTALVLAAGRGPDDPMARAFGVSHKCLVEVGGVAMLARVLATLRAHPAITRIAVSIEDEALVRQAIGPLPGDVFVIPSGRAPPPRPRPFWRAQRLFIRCC